MADAVTVFVCRDCRGARRNAELVRDETDARVRLVGCQKICDDHTVGVRRDGELVWFAEIDSAPRRRALVAFVEAASPAAIPKRLKRLLVRKRTGRLRTP